MKLKCLYSGLLCSLFLLAGSAYACPASYVKQKAEENQGTDLYNKSVQIAEKYMNGRGMDPRSPLGEVTRPYVIGTTLVEHDFNGIISSTSYYEEHNKPSERIDLNKDTVEEAATKALGIYAGKQGEANTDVNGHGFTPCWDHFNRHFGNAIHLAGDLNEPGNSKSQGG
ncbi:MAG: hypothetical protein QF752_01250 [Planctomycetota bacterium]|nr:hypothetical protein [Planctomycetota bacterium]